MVKPGDVLVNPNAMEGWKRIKIIDDDPEVVGVKFLEPLDWWAKDVTGLLKRGNLKGYRKEVDVETQAREVDFAVERLYLKGIDGILARGQKKGL